MVTVYKTNVSSKSKAKTILQKLTKEVSGYKINFDLEDCDKILRIEGINIDEKKIINFLNTHKIQFEELV